MSEQEKRTNVIALCPPAKAKADTASELRRLLFDYFLEPMADDEDAKFEAIGKLGEEMGAQIRAHFLGRGDAQRMAVRCYAAGLKNAISGPPR